MFLWLTVTVDSNAISNNYDDKIPAQAMNIYESCMGWTTSNEQQICVVTIVTTHITLYQNRLVLRCVTVNGMYLLVLLPATQADSSFGIGNGTVLYCKISRSGLQSSVKETNCNNTTTNKQPHAALQKPQNMLCSLFAAVDLQ